MTSLEPELGVVDFMDDNDEKKMRKKRKLQQKGSKKQKKQKIAHAKQTEENGDESDQDVEQNKPENKPKQKTEAPKRDAGESFASAIQAILNKRADVEEPVIAKSKEIVQLKKETKEKEKHDRLSQKQKQLLLNKDHKIPDFTNAEHESKLRKIATRGVVKLFNAVNKQQKLIGNEEATHRNFEKMSKLSKEKFLELLKTSNKKEITAEQAQDIVTRKTKSPVLANTNQTATKKEAASAKQKPAAKKKTDDSIPKEREEGPKWGALRDDFMLGAKMKDWNKTIEEEVQYDHEADDEGSGSD